MPPALTDRLVGGPGWPRSTVRPSGTGASGSKPRLGRPVIVRWAASPSSYMAAPATRPAALRARIRRCRLAHLCSRPATLADEGRSRMRRCIGLDVHREFAQVAIWEDGGIWQAGPLQTPPEARRLFADSLCVTDEVALEATGNTYAIARLLEQHVSRVVVSNPQKTRAIAEAKGKTDKGEQ